MIDAYKRGLERAFARKKEQQRELQQLTAIKPIEIKVKVNVASGFDEELYQATIINKMIQLIRKTKGANQ
jgi:hypothetical protein